MSDYQGNYVTRIQWAKANFPKVTLYGTDGVVAILNDSVAVVFGLAIRSAFEAAEREEARLAEVKSALKACPSGMTNEC